MPVIIFELARLVPLKLQIFIFVAFEPDTVPAFIVFVLIVMDDTAKDVILLAYIFDTLLI